MENRKFGFKMDRTKLYIAIAFLAVFLVGAFTGAEIHRKWTKPDVVQVDTATTIRGADLISSQTEVVPDTKPAQPAVIIPAERIQKSDSTGVQVKPEAIKVSGQLTGGIKYNAVLTGVQPAIQSLHVDYPERLITKTVQRPYQGWLLSATTDIGVTGFSPFYANARAAIEFSYNTGPFHFGLQGGALAENFSGKWGVRPYIGGRITIDILQFKN